MELIKIRRNFQVTLPQTLREKLGLAVGDYVQADLEGERIVIRPVETQPRTGKRKRSRNEREAAYAILEEIWAGMKGEEPAVIEKIVNEAVNEARRR